MHFTVGGGGVLFDEANGGRAVRTEHLGVTVDMETGDGGDHALPAWLGQEAAGHRAVRPSLAEDIDMDVEPAFYNSKEAGAKLDQMLSMGLSKPWPVALEAITGKPEMDATAIKDYFAPLQKWLDEQNKGKAVGW